MGANTVGRWLSGSRVLLKLAIFAAVMGFSAQVFAAAGITYHGRIMKPDGINPVTSATTQFRIQIRSPGNCILWEEQQSKDLSLTRGTFEITIADTFEPSLIVNTLPFTLERVFSNRTSFSGLTGCTSGTTYNPNSSDNRLLVVFFRENSTDPWEQMPTSRINFVPLALNAVQLGGYEASEFLKIASTSTYTPLTAPQVNTLMEIIGGTNAQYLRPTTTFAGDVSGTYNTASVDKIKGVTVSTTAPTNGQVLKLVGGVWTPSTDATGTSPGDASYSAKGLVQINTDQATSGLYIASGVLALPNVITAATTQGSASSIPVISYDSKGRLTAVTPTTVNDTTKLPLAGGTMTGAINMGTQNITNATSIASTNVSTRNVILADGDTNTITIKAPTNATATYDFILPPTGGTSGHVLSTDGNGELSWISPTSSGVSSTDYAADVAPAALCTDVQTVYWNTVADKWACQNIKVTGAGAFFVNGGNTLGAAATIGTNDNFALNFETNGSNKMTILNDGKVGIGAASPSTLLEVAGDLTLSTGANRKISIPKPASGNGNSLSIQAPEGATNSDNGGSLTLSAGNGYYSRAGASLTMDGSGFSGGNVKLIAGTADNNGAAGTVTIEGGPSGANQLGGNVYVKGGAGGSSNTQGGTVFLTGGVPGGSSTYGHVSLGHDGTAAVGFVGVGTNTPTTTLDVNGAVTQRGMAAPAVSATGQGRIYFDSTSNKFRVSQNGGAYTDLVGAGGGGTGDILNGGNSFNAAMTLGTNDNFGLNFETNGTTKMTISNGGLVGVGTTSPDASIHIVSSFLGEQLRLQNTEADATQKYGAIGGGHYTNAEEPVTLGLTSSSSTDNFVTFGGGVTSMNAATVVNFYTAANSTTLNGTERMRIDSSGRVGIGTTTPDSILDVNGALTQHGIAAPATSPSGQGRIYFDSTSLTFKVSENGGAYVNLVGSGGSGTPELPVAGGSAGTPGYGFSGDTNTGLFSAVADSLGLSTAGTERLGIDSSGRVGIGRAPATNSKVAVQGTVAGATNIIGTGANVNLALSNTHLLKLPGTDVIALSNLVDGGVYTIYITDTTQRMYTFTGCNSTYYSPAPANTSFRSSFTISVIEDSSSFTCFINWSTGFN